MIHFFSKEKAAKFFGRSLSIAGTIFILAGIYEFITRNKIVHLTEGFHDQMPAIINNVIDNIDNAPVVLKTLLGSSMMTTGRWLRGLNKNNED